MINVFRRSRAYWTVAIDQGAATESTIKAGETGKVHCLLGFLITPDGNGTWNITSDTAPGGAGTETSHTGVHKMLDGAAVGFRSDEDTPFIVGLSGEGLVLETGTSSVSGFFYGYTDNA